VTICQKKGLHSLRLLPHYPALKAHLDVLEAMPISNFVKPTHLPSLEESLDLLEEDLSRKKNKIGPAWGDWRRKVRIGYERLVDTLWNVAKEFDVRGYGIVLREKLTTKWCDCGCSTDHLGEVCERTVREEEEESGIRSGKEREWDGRGTSALSFKYFARPYNYFVQGVEYLAGRRTKKRTSGKWILISADSSLKNAMALTQR